LKKSRAGQQELGISMTEIARQVGVGTIGDAMAVKGVKRKTVLKKLKFILST
jgi:hypothetical protein